MVQVEVTAEWQIPCAASFLFVHRWRGHKPHIKLHDQRIYALTTLQYFVLTSITQKVLKMVLVVKEQLKVDQKQSRPTPLCSFFIRKSGPPGFVVMWGYLAFILASSACTGLAFFSWESWGDDAQCVKSRQFYCWSCVSFFCSTLPAVEQLLMSRELIEGSLRNPEKRYF